MRTRLSVLVATALFITSCGGGDDSGAAVPIVTAPASDGGDEAAVASVEAIDLVWVLDGESVGPTFDYSEPIDRGRYDAGLRLELSITTDGDVGGIEPDLVLPVEINDDQIDAGTTLGPERAITRPNRANISIVETETGFFVSIDVGRPISPVSLVESRARAAEFGLDPDVENQSLGDGEFSLDVAGLLDLPSAPVAGRNAIEYGMRGSIEFGNGFVLDDIDETVALVVSETPSVDTGSTSQCDGIADSYLELFDQELADPDAVLLDRFRAYDTLLDAAAELECGLTVIAIPICQAVEGVADAPPGLLDRHLAECPDDVEMVEATIFEPTLIDGVVQMVIPRTRDGLPAYAVALSFPAWEVFTTSEGPSRQKITLTESDDLAVKVDIAVSAMPPSILADQVAEVVPASPDATLLVDDTTTIADRPATRFIADNGTATSAGVGDFEVGTVIEVDDERLLYLRGSLAGVSLDGDEIVEMMACIESSLVIEEFVFGTTLVPAADCTALGDLTADAPVDDAAELSSLTITP